jgi:hypothetical protein
LSLNAKRSERSLPLAENNTKQKQEATKKDLVGQGELAITPTSKHNNFNEAST